MDGFSLHPPFRHKPTPLTCSLGGFVCKDAPSPPFALMRVKWSHRPRFFNGGGGLWFLVHQLIRQGQTISKNGVGTGAVPRILYVSLPGQLKLHISKPQV